MPETFSWTLFQDLVVLNSGFSPTFGLVVAGKFVIELHYFSLQIGVDPPSILYTSNLHSEY